MKNFAAARPIFTSVGILFGLATQAFGQVPEVVPIQVKPAQPVQVQPVTPVPIQPATTTQKITTGNLQGQVIHGRVIRVPAPGQFVIQTSDGKDFLVYSNQSTVFRHNNKNIPVTDIRVGTIVDAAYVRDDNRFVATTLSIGSGAPVVVQPQTTRVIQGRLIRMGTNPPQLVVATEDGKEIVLFLDNAQVTTVRFQEHGDQRVLVSLSTAADRTSSTSLYTPAPAGTRVEGTIVRIDSTGNQLVLRNKTGQEVFFMVNPETVYRVGDRVVRINEFQPGQSVSLIYNVRDRHNVVQSVVAVPVAP